VQEFVPEPEAIVSTPQPSGNIEHDIPRFLSDPMSVRLYQEYRCVADEAMNNESIEIAGKLGRAPLASAASAPR
jgi:hypothetical protein